MYLETTRLQIEQNGSARWDFLTATLHPFIQIRPSQATLLQETTQPSSLQCRMLMHQWDASKCLLRTLDPAPVFSYPRSLFGTALPQPVVLHRSLGAGPPPAGRLVQCAQGPHQRHGQAGQHQHAGCDRALRLPPRLDTSGGDYRGGHSPPCGELAECKPGLVRFETEKKVIEILLTTLLE
jgi:hypothetical protein